MTTMHWRPMSEFDYLRENEEFIFYVEQTKMGRRELPQVITGTVNDGQIDYDDHVRPVEDCKLSQILFWSEIDDPYDSSNITPEEKQILTTALEYWQLGLGGVMTIIDPAGNMSTNFVPYKVYFSTHPFTDDHRKFCLKLWDEKIGSQLP